MTHPFADSPEFRRLLEGNGADLTRIALEIARDASPGLDASRYLGRIGELADRVRERCASGITLRPLLGQINWVLFIEEKFRGDSENYYDPRNSYLNDVIDRKLGIPISLSVLYLAIADRLGLHMSGVNLPGHFLIRAGHGSDVVFVDPFHGGALLDREGCERRVAEVTGQTVSLDAATLAPCSTADVVARMLRNLKAIYLREHDFASSVPILRRLVALLRDDPVERRDLGVACLRADRPGEAVGHLSAYLKARPKADDFEAVEDLLRLAKVEMAARN